MHAASLPNAIGSLKQIIADLRQHKAQLEEPNRLLQAILLPYTPLGAASLDANQAYLRKYYDQRVHGVYIRMRPGFEPCRDKNGTVDNL